MPKNDQTAKAHRPTLADQNARQHELLMAYATKPARQGAEETVYGTHTNGPEKNRLYVKDLRIIGRDGEEDVARLGREEAALRDRLAMLARINNAEATAETAADAEAR